MHVSLGHVLGNFETDLEQSMSETQEKLDA